MRGGYRWGRRALLAAGILPLWLGGCQVPEPRVPVVGVKNAGAGAAAGKGGRETGIAAEEGGEAASMQQKTEEAAGLDVGSSVEGAQGASQAESIRERTKALEVYEVQLKTDAIQLQGEAAVWVPEGEDLPVYRAVNQPYSQEEREAYKELAGEFYGIVWEETEAAGWELSADGIYDLSFPSSDASTPIFWISRAAQDITHGGDGEFQPDAAFAALVSQGKAGTEEEREVFRRRMEEQSREFISRLAEEGLCTEEFSEPSLRWLGIRTRNERTGELEPGRYGLALHYGRSCGDVPAPGGGLALMGSAGSRLQYMEFVYADDGTLLELKSIGRESLAREDAGFLLPFEAAADIFEQYARTYYDTHEGRLEDFFAGAFADLNGEGITVGARLTRAALEYRYVPFEGGAGTENGGLLCSVWNFYGAASAARTQADARSIFSEVAPAAEGQELLLASVDASDGRVYGE